MHYRVRRYSLNLEGGVSSPLYTIWEGDFPNEYHGGIGAFDEGDSHPSRWFEERETCNCGTENAPSIENSETGVLCDDCGGTFGIWREIPDPRTCIPGRGHRGD